MRVLDKSSPLIIQTSRFSNFEKYLSSLSKPCSYATKRALAKVSKSHPEIKYEPVRFDPKECREFMDLWADCNGWSWGDWYGEEELQSLHDRGILHCFSCGIAYHFVLKWGNYVYCNSPLYDTKQFKKIGIGKWMWIKLIEYSINNKWGDYIDLMGPEGFNTFGEVIANRDKTNEPGDFGYKWSLVPEDIKEGRDNTLDHLEIVSEKTFCWKGVCLPPKPTKLLIIAHPDDEAIFFGDWLMENGRDTKVVCLTSSMDYNVWYGHNKNQTRFKELKDCLKKAGVSYFECLGVITPSLNTFPRKPFFRDFLNKINKETNWEMVVTHNQHGEYGHMQHIETFDIVKDVFPNDKIHIYKNSKTKLPTNRKQILLDQYVSQQEKCLKEIRTSEWTGSDWYKHTVGKNMIDYESIEKLEDTKTSFRIVSYWGGSNDYTTVDFIKKLSEQFCLRGHKSVFSRVFNSWPWDPDIFLVFRRDDAEECIRNNRDFYYFIDDEALLNEQNFEEYHEIIDKSVRSFTRTWKMRNQIGDKINLVWVPRERSWDILTKKVEAHLLMGLISATLAQSGRASDL